MNFRVIEWSAEDPAMNLAVEEALLQPFIKHEGQRPLIRLWHNIEWCIVLGRSEAISARVHMAQAQSAGVKVYRRVSGGGTVLQGPGNLNLSFFLPFELHSDLQGIRSSACWISSWVARALQKTLASGIRVRGSGDLCLGDYKISGCAQARKRHGMLHHLTLLEDMNIERIDELLLHPDRQPDYRENRKHKDFVTSIKTATDSYDRKVFIDHLLSEVDWEKDDLQSEERGVAQQWMDNKYAKSSWHELGKVE